MMFYANTKEKRKSALKGGFSLNRQSAEDKWFLYLI